MIELNAQQVGLGKRIKAGDIPVGQSFYGNGDYGKRDLFFVIGRSEGENNCTRVCRFERFLVVNEEKTRIKEEAFHNDFIVTDYLPVDLYITATLKKSEDNEKECEIAKIAFAEGDEK